MIFKGYSHFPNNIAPTGATGPTGPTGATGEDGDAATVRVGTVTTGDPGTEASVVNSGTEKDAVLDFTIPRGQDGQSGATIDLLSAYSTPSHPGGTGNNALIFDRNALSYGTSISHALNSATFTINQPGVYAVAFNGGMAPGSGVTFPYNISFTLELNGSSVAGASASHNFHTSTETVNIAFTSPVAVSSAPATLRVIGSGSKYFYSDISLTIYRLGDIPT